MPAGWRSREVEKYRPRFIKRQAEHDQVFGAVFIPTPTYAKGLVSPREKGQMFTSADATVLGSVTDRTCYVFGPNKATLNAPLLLRVAQQYQPTAVLHLHEQLPGVRPSPMPLRAPSGTTNGRFLARCSTSRDTGSSPVSTTTLTS